MTPQRRTRPAPAARTDTAPAWGSADADLPGRMLTLVYRVARQTGLSRRPSVALCRRLLCAQPGVNQACPGLDTPVGRAAERRVRARILIALRAELEQRIDRARLEAALRDATLLDEVTLLPPRQRAALWSVAVDHCAVTELAARTGWSPLQIARLLRAAMRTVSSAANLPRRETGATAGRV
ncbi:hypothetical protein [Amycolatopsis nalaikhensis]|uniref:Uncharacterized protein n=1 Tax=Amycolatopsis nalaikhensis TaxID=715472 RepID=A0ABY8XU60_9PSEU|nr:hypothetical protein [Amycolatopsis sp. 2-2]WIV59239.1 hypothetical protein QP939_11715 [Amycolatopsis sp. 2-2]